MLAGEALIYCVWESVRVDACGCVFAQNTSTASSCKVHTHWTAEAIEWKKCCHKALNKSHNPNLWALQLFYVERNSLFSVHAKQADQRHWNLYVEDIAVISSIFFQTPFPSDY